MNGDTGFCSETPLSSQWLRMGSPTSQALFCSCCVTLVYHYLHCQWCPVPPGLFNAYVYVPSLSEVYSCSLDGTVLAWNVSTLRVTSRFQLPYGDLMSISLHGDRLWCCKFSGRQPVSMMP